MTAHCHTFHRASPVGGAFGYEPSSRTSIPAAPSLAPMQGTYPAEGRESVGRNDGFDMTHACRAMADTAGMTDPERTVFWMEKLGWQVHRGRGDTLGAAVQRAASMIGAPVSLSKRCWDRWKEMKSVSGSVMIPFMLAYEDLCQRIEDKAGEYERQVLQLKGGADEIDRGPVPSGAGVAASAPRKEGSGG